MSCNSTPRHDKHSDEIVVTRDAASLRSEVSDPYSPAEDDGGVPQQWSIEAGNDTPGFIGSQTEVGVSFVSVDVHRELNDVTVWGEEELGHTYDNEDASAFEDRGVVAVEAERNRRRRRESQDLGFGMFVADMPSVMQLRGMLEFPLDALPRVNGVLIADVLCLILQYCSDKRTLLAVSATCHMWRFYSNYLPHWTYFTLSETMFVKRMRIKESKTVVMRNPGTRDAILDHYRVHVMNDTSTLRSRFWVNFLLQSWLIPSLMTAGLVAAHWFISWKESLDNDGIFDDVTIGLSVFFTLVILVVVELLFVMLGVRYFAPRLLVHYWRAMFTVAFVSLVLLVPLSLAAARYTSAVQIRKGGTTSLTAFDGTAIGLCRSPGALSRVPSYVSLPAPLSDPRWRHYPTNKSIADLVHTDLYCSDESDICVTLLYDYEHLLNDPATYNHVIDWSLPAPPLGPCPSHRVPGLFAAFAVPSELQALMTNGKLGYAVSYRVIRSVSFFSAEPHKGVIGRYYSDTNPLWSQLRLMLINVRWAESPAESDKRVDDLLEIRQWILIACIGIVGISVILPLFTRRDPAVSLLSMCALAAVSVNPVMIAVLGVLCLQRDDDPRNDDNLLMCDNKGGEQLVGLAGAQSLLIAVVFVVRWYRRRRSQRNSSPM